MMIDLTELQAEVHALAREKGWYDDRDLSDPDVRAAMLCLIHSEVSEALECVRRGEMALEYEAFVGGYDAAGRPINKPVGFPSELADVVIRALDFAAAFDVKMHYDDDSEFSDTACDTPTGVAAALFELHCTISEFGVGHLWQDCRDIAQALGFDLLEVIKIKHEYNKTRPVRHGGKAL